MLYKLRVLQTDPKVESHNYLIAISERRIPDGGTVYGDKYKPMTETSKKEIASIYDILSKLAKQAFSVIEHYKPKGQKIGHQKAYSTKDLPRKNENCNKDQLLKSVEEKFIVEYCSALGTLEKIMNREGQVYLKRDLQLWIKKLLRVLNHLALFSSEINEEGKRIVRNLLGNHNSLETLKNFLLKLIEPDFAKGDYTGLMDLIDQQTHSIGVDKIWNGTIILQFSFFLYPIIGIVIIF
ncbi:expressed protein [Phakopsora pachyrhizi]|uniref:Expressed protein n=1 Tax=Phakopsora pachyrhizi TaxID=170000 RepID=A0AAV0BGM3_PHAPC|nr:expressed protein [Phakopsora pachyrhizi]